MRTQDCPECRWVPVVDGSGRRRLEMRWQLPVAAPAGSSIGASVASTMSRAA